MKVILCLIWTVFITYRAPGNTDSLLIADGGALFNQNCTACHQLQQRLVGPPLMGVNQRHGEAWLLKFIRSSQTMIQGGDSAAIALFNTFNKVPMPDQNLTEMQIRSILAFIEDAGKPSSVVEEIPRPEAQNVTANVRPPKFSDFRFWILYTVTVVLVIVSIYYKAELIALRKKVDLLPEE